MPLKVSLKKDYSRNKYVYLMLIPVIIYFVLFHYIPMYGAQIAFKDYRVTLGIAKSPWAVPFYKHFADYINSYYFWRLIRNTFLINIYDVLFGFPLPIVLALLINEVRIMFFKRAVQTITYLPHFLSTVVICGIVTDFFSVGGVVNDFVELVTGDRISFLMQPNWFRPLFVGSGIWQEIGWGSIIYLAALSGVDEELYEAAKIDGAGRWKQVIHVTIPSILPTIIIMLILRLGHMMFVGSDKILLLYNPSTYETADVISTFVYRKGLLEANYSYSSAVGLINSVVNFVFLITVNKLSRTVSETSLW
jgi:putative aldouronate transport system permease protein